MSHDDYEQYEDMVNTVLDLSYRQFNFKKLKKTEKNF